MMIDIDQADYRTTSGNSAATSKRLSQLSCTVAVRKTSEPSETYE